MLMLVSLGSLSWLGCNFTRISIHASFKFVIATKPKSRKGSPEDLGRFVEEEELA